MKTYYGNLCVADEDKIEIKHGSVGGEHPAKDNFQHRTHNLGGAIHKPEGALKLRTHKLGGALGEGAITDTTPVKHEHKLAKGMGAIGY